MGHNDELCVLYLGVEKVFFKSRPINLFFAQAFFVLELPVYEHMHLEENHITSLNNNLRHIKA